MAKILSRYRLPSETVAKIEKIRKRLGAKSTAVAVERVIAAFDLNAPVLTISVGTEKTPFVKPDVIAQFVTPKSFAQALNETATKVILAQGKAPTTYAQVQKQHEARMDKILINAACAVPDKVVIKNVAKGPTITLRVAPNRQ